MEMATAKGKQNKNKRNGNGEVKLRGMADESYNGIIIPTSTVTLN